MLCMHGVVANSGRRTSFLDTATSGVLCILRGKFALRASDSLLRFLPKLARSPAAVSASSPFCKWPPQSCDYRRGPHWLVCMQGIIQPLSLWPAVLYMNQPPYD